mmetsp:Transcript_90572/g.194210  ORF Transcript_90572/g.194210 Transcript_90572/m.194210 type:complete len:175 (-) Transcript_90572:49-573(-)
MDLHSWVCFARSSNWVWLMLFSVYDLYSLWLQELLGFSIMMIWVTSITLQSSIFLLTMQESDWPFGEALLLVQKRVLGIFKCCEYRAVHTICGWFLLLQVVVGFRLNYGIEDFFSVSTWIWGAWHRFRMSGFVSVGYFRVMVVGMQLPVMVIAELTDIALLLKTPMMKTARKLT